MRTQNKRPRIAIAGCGFGGLTLAKELSKMDVEILLIDKNNYHTFQPLLYQVATGGLEADNIAYPVRKIFRKMDNVFFRKPDHAESGTVADHEEFVGAAGSCQCSHYRRGTGRSGACGSDC